MNTIAKELRVNQLITSKEIRLINQMGAHLGIVSFAEALRLAQEQGLDLVEVSPNAAPPVCRIMDYGKFKYQQSKRLHQAKRKNLQSVSHTKEIKLRPQIEEHDFQFKMRHVKEFLSQGDKTKITLIFRGREITHPERGEEILKRIREEVQDMSVVEQSPKLEGKTLTMTLAPKS